MTYKLLFVTLLIAAVVIGTGTVAAQGLDTEEFNVTVGTSGNDSMTSVASTNDGGYIFAGSMRYRASGDAWLIKTDSDGNIELNETYGGASSEGVDSVIATSDGGYAFAGTTRSFGSGFSNGWFIKTDTDGNVEINKTFGGSDIDDTGSVVQTSDGGYALAGQTGSLTSGFGSNDMWFIKLDADGNEEFNKTYGGSDFDRANSIAQTSDGGYAIAGRTDSFGSDDIWLMKLNSSGGVEINETFGGTNYDTPNSVVQTSDGGYVIAGRTSSFGSGSGAAWFIKTDSNGDVEINETFGGSEYDYATSAVQTSDGGYALAGRTNSFGSGERDAWFLKLDSEGGVELNETYGGVAGDTASSIIQASDGGYVFAGATDSFGDSGEEITDAWLLKMGSSREKQTVERRDLSRGEDTDINGIRDRGRDNRWQRDTRRSRGRSR